MGSSVVRRLLATRDADVAVLTRDPGSAKAVALAEFGAGRVRLVPGDLDDPHSLTRALDGIGRVFANTDFFATAEVHGEYRQGVGLLEAARAAGVDRFIWSSLDDAAALTGGTNPVPHYDAKAAVAAYIQLMRSDETMRRAADGWYTSHVSILTTAPYFENLPRGLPPRPGPLPDGRDGLIFELALGDGRWPLIALDDIAWFAGHMFDDWQGWGARDLAVVAEGLTGAEIAATFEKVTGRPAAYRPVPPDVLTDAIPGVGHDFAAMFRFFQERDLFARDRDVAGLRALHPALLSFEAWLRSTGWDGSPAIPATRIVRAGAAA